LIGDFRWDGRRLAVHEHQDARSPMLMA